MLRIANSAVVDSRTNLIITSWYFNSRRGSSLCLLGWRTSFLKELEKDQTGNWKACSEVSFSHQTKMTGYYFQGEVRLGWSILRKEKTNFATAAITLQTAMIAELTKEFAQKQG